MWESVLGAQLNSGWKGVPCIMNVHKNMHYILYSIRMEKEICKITEKSESE